MVQLPRPPKQKWYNSSQALFWGLVIFTGTLAYLDIVDQMNAIGAVALLGGTTLAQHADSLQRQVDQLLELERRRQETSISRDQADWM